jgi:hypothetical protein
VNEIWERSADDDAFTRDEVFGWRGSSVVLFGDYHDERWTVSRGWIEGDALKNVRRWTFAAPSAFAGQVRRLVLEATNDGTMARLVSSDALRWAEQQAASQPLA